MRRVWSRARPALRWVERAVALAMVVYVSLHAFPQVLFAHSARHGGIAVYSREPLPEVVGERLAEVHLRLEASDLAGLDRDQRIFLTGSRMLYRVFAPFARQAFAASIPWTGNIFIADADLLTNTARSATPEFNLRTFTGVATHEIVHDLLRQRLGLLASRSTPRWLIEGYCDLVAGESSFPEDRGMALLASGQSDPSRAFQYFTWWRMVEYLMTERGFDFDELFENPGDAAAIEAEMRAHVRSRPDRS